MNIAGILHHQARTAGDRAAIVQRRGSITFADLDRRSAAAADDLVELGLAPGMRALVFGSMSIDLYVTLIALFRLKVTAVFVDPSAGSGRVASCVSRLRPNAFLAERRAHLLRLAVPAIRSIPLTAVFGAGLPCTRRVARRIASEAGTVDPCADDEAAIVTFTSGSTGEPRAASRTHGFLVAQHRVLTESLALSAGQIDLTTLPIFLLANLASGVTSIVPDADLRIPGDIDPAPVLRQIAHLRPDRTVASPAFLYRLVSAATASGQRLDSFRQIFTGGAPVFPSQLDAIARVAPAAEVVAVYGSTEAEPIAHVDRRHIDAADRDAMRNGAGLLAGEPEPSIDLRILPDRWGTPLGPWSPEDLARETIGPNQIGEIVVSGAHVLRGYVDGEGDAETKVTVGDRVWHRTGDAGYLDARGRLWLLGRCAARITDDRGVVYPFAVECAVSDVRGLRRSALVQHDHRRTLVLEPDPGHDSSSLRQEIARRVSWTHVDHVRLLHRIPVDRRHNAKVDYPALRRTLARDQRNVG